jgi:threonine/homoserine/homoserine lactone efflux protein
LLELIIRAVVTGFILSVMVGPAFFVLLETSISKGIRAGLAFDVGVLLADIIYIALAFLFYNQVKSLADGKGEDIAAIVGGILCILFGLFTFFKKPKTVVITDSKYREQIYWKEYRLLSLKGFLLNIANPLVIFYWFSVMSLGHVDKIEGLSNRAVLLIFIGIILLTFFSIDFLKIAGAKQLRPFITNKLLKSLNHLVGIVFLIFGIILIVQGIVKYS